MIHLAALYNIGANASPNEIAKLSIADFILRIAPPIPPSISLAILFEAPLEPSMDLVSFL